MPALVLSSRNTTDSQQLRQAAQKLGWETLRLDGRRIPDWFDPPDADIAMFYTAPHAFEIAAQLSRTLLGCDADWIIRMPEEFRRREVRRMTLSQALALPGKSFVKHALSKAFPAAVYDRRGLAEAARKVQPNRWVHVCEPVQWLVEYRCFVRDRAVKAISAYLRHGEAIEDHSSLLGAPPEEIDTARRYAASLLESPAVECPAAFVLDVGIIEGRGWAVVECNECWASGIYACDPTRVLETLLGASVPSKIMTVEDRRWDFKKHYFAACP